MPPRANPPTLGELLAQGTIDDIAQAIIASVPKGTDLIDTSILYDAVVRGTPALLPSTFNAVLSRVGREVEQRWADTPDDEANQAQLTAIPIESERTGKAADETGRILYRVVVEVPYDDGKISRRTVYVDSSFPLTFDQLKSRAIADLAQSLRQHRDRYLEFEANWQETSAINIQNVSRSF